MDDLVPQRIALGEGELRILQPREAAELPDDGPVEWAPLAPYSAVLWRSGVALAREVAEAALERRRVVELGCGLGAPSLAAAVGGAEVLATDADPEALELIELNARENRVAVGAERVDWATADALVGQGPFDLVLAADVLYERQSVEPLLALLPRLGRETWLADAGRPAADAFLEQARERRWTVVTSVRDDMQIHRLRM